MELKFSKIKSLNTKFDPQEAGTVKTLKEECYLRTEKSGHSLVKALHDINWPTGMADEDVSYLKYKGAKTVAW